MSEKYGLLKSEIEEVIHDCGFRISDIIGPTVTDETFLAYTIGSENAYINLFVSYEKGANLINHLFEQVYLSTKDMKDEEERFPAIFETKTIEVLCKEKCLDKSKWTGKINSFKFERMVDLRDADNESAKKNLEGALKDVGYFSEFIYRAYQKNIEFQERLQKEVLAELES